MTENVCAPIRPGAGTLAVVCTICTVLVMRAHATPQELGEVVISDGRGGSDTLYMDDRPLSDYFNTCLQVYPFEMTSTANYRGYVGTWKISHDSLYLVDLRIGDRHLVLDSIALVPRRGPLFAGFFSGCVGLYSRDLSSRKMLEFHRGIATQAVSSRKWASPDEMDALSPRCGQSPTPDQARLACGYKNDAATRARSAQIARYVKSERDSIASRIAREQADERSRTSARISKLCSVDPGYATFQETFTTVRSDLGLINAFPYSAFFMLEVKRPQTIRSAWLWVPVAGDTISAGFGGVLDYFHEAEAHLSSISWIRDWAKASPDHDVELHIFGGGLGETGDELSRVGEAAWKVGGYSGSPRYKILLRHKDRAIATLYLHPDQEGALMTSLDPTAHAPTNALIGERVFFHSASDAPHLITIFPDGTHKVQ